MYRIAVLTDLKHEGEHYAKVINDYCINQKLFPLLETYQNQEVFFKEIQTHIPVSYTHLDVYKRQEFALQRTFYDNLLRCSFDCCIKEIRLFGTWWFKFLDQL